METTPFPSWTAPSIAVRPRPNPGARWHADAPSLRIQALWVVAWVLFCFLMFSFLGVVQQAVDRAQQHRLQGVDRAHADTRCQSEPAYRQRQACLARLNATIAVDALR